MQWWDEEAIGPEGGSALDLLAEEEDEAEESGAGLMTFSGTDSVSGAMISVVSQWMATGRGRADATATDGTVSGTRTECWDDSFRETYNYTPWAKAPALPETGDMSLCPVFSSP